MGTQRSITIEVLENGNVTLNGIEQDTGARRMPRGGYLERHRVADMSKLRKRLQVAGITPPRGMQVGSRWEHPVGVAAIATWEDSPAGFTVCVALETDNGEPLRAPYERNGRQRREEYVIESPFSRCYLIPLG